MWRGFAKRSFACSMFAASGAIFAVAMLVLLGPRIASAGSAILTWTAPTQNEDGTPLTDLDKYTIYSGCLNSGQYERAPIDVNGSLLSLTVSDLPEGGNCYFVATAWNTLGTESRHSGEAIKLIAGTGQLSDPVENLQITWQESEGVPIMALDDTSLIVRYYVEEAASGTTPTDLLDSSGVGTAFDLPITYGTNLSYTEVSGNRGLNSSAIANGIATSGVLSAGNKIFDDLDGSLTATLEYVIDLSDYSTNGGRVFGLMNGTTGNGTFLMTGAGSTNPGTSNSEIRLNGNNVSPNLGTIIGRHVIHLVHDGDAADSNDRNRLYVDGVLVPNSGTPAAGVTISFSSTRLVVLNRGSQNRGVTGTFFYGAIYSDAFDATRAAAHYDVLIADDDTPAGGAASLIHNRQQRQFAQLRNH